MPRRFANPRSALVALLALGLLHAPLGAQAGQPDVFIATLDTAGGTVRVGAVHNITERPGYDNQPSFALDGRSVFYTSTRGDAQADIYRYSLTSRRTERVTTTASESEYSAVEVPGGGAISVIRVERDSTQRLWHLPLGGGDQLPLFPTLKPVGYQAWADARRVAMFVLGTPSALVLGDRASGALDTVMFNVGRSLHRVPGSSRISFVSKAYEAAWYIMSLDVDTRVVVPLVRLPAGTEDYAWLPDGRLIAGSGSALFVCDLARQSQWEQVADLGSSALSSISRLAVSPSGDMVAIVAVPTASRR